MKTMNTVTNHIRGEHAYVSKPSTAYVVLATSFDLTFAWFVLCVLAIARGATPVFGLSTIAAYLATLAVLWFGQRLWGTSTLGERLWDIRAARAHFMKITRVQASPLRNTRLTIGTFLTALAVMITAWITYETVARSPLGVRAEEAQWDVFLPDLTAGAGSGERFTVVPFYYSLGAWPRIFQGHEVFFNFPYAKGPPLRFAAEAQARWSMPEIRVTFEGPRTPAKTSSTPYSRAEVENCIEDFWNSPLTALSCLGVRQAVLSRHFDAFRAQRLNQIGLKWIRVANPSLPVDEQVEGFYLSAKDATRGQDRFVLLTARGTEQTFILDYPRTFDGEHAREVFQESIRSLRVSDDLVPGRVWIDQTLERVKLDELDAPGTPGANDSGVARLAEIQAMLIARITVDPKMIETYYHLGGTALMLARIAAKARLHATDPRSADLAAEWLAVAKPLTETAWKYATDIAPDDKRTLQLHSFVLEAQKL
jgi:hypothetical protein